MSWHTSGFLVRWDWYSRPMDLFRQLGLGEPEMTDRVPFEEATPLNLQGRAIGLEAKANSSVGMISLSMRKGNHWRTVISQRVKVVPRRMR